MINTPRQKLGKVRSIAPGVSIQGVIYPDQKAASYMLRIDAYGTIVERELTVHDLSRAIAALLLCSTETVRALRVHREWGIGTRTPVGTPRHLKDRA